MSMYFTISLPEQAVWRDQRSKREKGRRGGERKDGKKVSGMGGELSLPKQGRSEEKRRREEKERERRETGK